LPISPVFVTNTLYEADKIYQALQKYTSNVLFFPMDDFITSEAIAISPDFKVSRLETLNTLIRSNKSNIVVTHLMGFLRYLPEKETWEKNIIKISKNMEINKDLLVRNLYDIGYSNEVIVTKTGEMGNRGYIVDIFPIKEENPVRIEFWGDTIDSIRYFDPETQLSLSDIDELYIYPFDEFIVNDIDIDVERKQKYLPLYTKKVSSIIDYIENPILIYKDYNQIKNAYIHLREEIFNYDIDNKTNIKTNYMHNLEDLNNNRDIYVTMVDDTLPQVKIDKEERYISKEANTYNGDFDILNKDLKEYLKLDKTIIICLKDDYQIRHFVSYLKEAYVITSENNIIDNTINIIKKAILKDT
jgi:transcription-repair coupling factor (superfamily II helicase)